MPATFGQELADIMEYESKTSNRKVPQIVEQCVEYLLKHGLETEGIFRFVFNVYMIESSFSSHSISAVHGILSYTFCCQWH